MAGVNGVDFEKKVSSPLLIDFRLLNMAEQRYIVEGDVPRFSHNQLDTAYFRIRCIGYSAVMVINQRSVD